MPKTESGRRKSKYFQWLTSNIGYPKLREHLGSVVAIMKLSKDWPNFYATLDRLHPRHGGFHFDFPPNDSGKGL